MLTIPHLRKEHTNMVNFHEDPCLLTSGKQQQITNDDVKGVWVRFNLDMVENVFGLLYPWCYT